MPSNPMYNNIYKRVYVCVHVCMYMYIHIYICMYACMHVLCICVFAFASIIFKEKQTNIHATIIHTIGLKSIAKLYNYLHL